jgi:hypothetical protein
MYAGAPSLATALQVLDIGGGRVSKTVASAMAIKPCVAPSLERERNCGVIFAKVQMALTETRL